LPTAVDSQMCSHSIYISVRLAWTCGRIISI